MNNDILLQPHRDINIKLLILDYSFNVFDELSGIATTLSLSNDSTSDIRRTASVSMLLDSGYTDTGVLNDIYFSAGNGFWFDKYLSISIGVLDESSQEVVYEPQGTYLINEPSVSYDATTNMLSFQAVDLMAKLTGMRTGNLQGITYQVPAGSVITDVIRNALLEQGFYKCVLQTPEEPNVPIEIKIESGGTTYDLLSQLRDINPNWEIFFDVDGTFIFQKIPSSEIINGVPEYSPTTVVDDSMWDNLLISYELSTSFEDVKNYIEVYGKTIEADDKAVDIAIDMPNANVSMKFPKAKYDDVYNNDVMFTLGDSGSEPVEFTTPIHTITFTDANGYTGTVNCEPNMWYTNMTYIIRVGMNKAEYLGYQQPCAVAWENNEASPFYVGNSVGTGATLITSDDKHIITNNGFNILAVQNIEANTPTDKVISQVQFENMVRVVCAGDEYDNIYSNQLAIDRAYYELYQRCRLHDQINITCVPIYTLDVNKVISITLPNEDKPSYWIVKSINTDFSVNGTQTINAMKYYAEYPSNQRQSVEISQIQRRKSFRNSKMKRG